MEYPPQVQSQDEYTYVQGYGIEPSPYALSEGPRNDLATVAGIAEASLTPADMGPMTVEKPASVEWKDFRGNDVAMANQKNTIRMSGVFSEAELAVAALKRDARIMAEVEAHEHHMAQQLMGASKGDITRNTLMGAEDEEETPAFAKIG